MDANMLGPVSLSVTQAVGSMQFFLPRLADVRKADPVANPDMVGDVRLGEVAAITLTTAVGAIIASMTKSAVPLVAAMFTSFILVCVYETALRGNKPGNPTPIARLKGVQDA